MTTNARKPKKGRVDTEAVRAAATGRWLEILERIGGIPVDVLDGDHHPCPKCGGEDRFRLVDESAGAVLCNQCLPKKNGDGFAAIVWMLGCSFPDAVKKVAEHLGVLEAATGEADCGKDLRFLPDNDMTYAWFLRAKPPITLAGIKLAGGRLAKYKEQYTVIAFPVIGKELDTAKPVGWALIGFNGALLPVWDKNANIVDRVKVKLTAGSKPGFVGLHAVERMKIAGLPDRVTKLEGITDVLAGQSAIPEQLLERHLVVTSANGSKENPKWMATILAGFNCDVMHDADEPGEIGAKEWATQIAQQAASGVTTRRATLPYAIEPNHGKDLRDYLGEGRSYADWLALLDQGEEIVVAKTATGDVDYTQVRYPFQEQILKKLQIEVLYEEEDGTIRVFSTLLRKSSTIKSVDQIKKSRLIQICGPPAKEMIVLAASDADGENSFSLSDVRDAIALIASNRRGKGDERGIGIWQGLDEWGNETETVVLVSNDEGARYNGDLVLRKILSPRADGLVLDLGSSLPPWYDFATVEKNLTLAGDVEWRCQAVAEVTKLFDRWRWRHQAIDPSLLSGLVLASWVQTFFAWRPLVAISGESNCGKSLLFDALGGPGSSRGIFGGLAFKTAKSTAAGVMQGIGKTARIALLDEFEASAERNKALEAFRQSSRGASRAVGTAHQKSTETRLQHIPWVAAVETGLQRQPDANRFIQFELLTAEEGKFGQLTIPESRELAELGQRLLAVAIRGGIKAKRLAVAMKSTQVPGVDARTVESYSVPAAMLAVAGDLDDAQARGLLVKLLGNVDRAEQGARDQDELLGDIMRASLLVNPRVGTKTIGQVLGDTRLLLEEGVQPRLESVGIRLLEDDHVFVAPKLVQQHLLRGGAWDGQKLDQILLRLTGAERRALRIGGHPTRGVFIPSTTIRPPEPVLASVAL